MLLDFVPSDPTAASPEGSPSFSRTEFHKRFSEWSPDWLKPVRFSYGKIKYEQLTLASLVYAEGNPLDDGFKNNDTLLLFENKDCFIVVPTDFFTRLLFTEQKYLQRPIVMPGIGETSVGEALDQRREPGDAFWKVAGLPGVPIAIGVNGSLRFAEGQGELLSLKKAGQAGGMSGTVGPPVSAAANLNLDKVAIEKLTLDALVSRAFMDALRREVACMPLPLFRRRKAWLDSGRGHKPEVNFGCTIDDEQVENYAIALRKEHAGTIKLCKHLTSEGSLLPDAEKILARWGLNFQAWFLWE